MLNRSAWLHRLCPIQSLKEQYDRLQHMPNTWSHQNLIQKHTQMPCSWPCSMPMLPLDWTPSSFLHLYIHGQVSSKHHHLQLHKTKHCKLNSGLPSLQPDRRKKEVTMISAKRIAHLAKKWQRMTALAK
uniref:Uncharacterized protein n=1 Tax=Arundo donax TaxID=35708 RepID=A0A0A9DKP5_ARUDO